MQRGAKPEILLPDEKLIVQDNFREPMHVRVPFPAWAMNREEAAAPIPTSSNGSINGATDDDLSQFLRR